MDEMWLSGVIPAADYGGGAGAPEEPLEMALRETILNLQILLEQAERGLGSGSPSTGRDAGFSVTITLRVCLMAQVL
jgi:hypothetical protein